MVLPPAGLPAVVMAAACAAQPPTNAFVVAGIDPPTIGSDFTLAQLRKLGEASQRIGKHRPYGFYIGSVAYGITADIHNAHHDLCEGPVDIRVAMRLTNRHIEIAKDLKPDACRLPKIEAHYRQHADADEAVFQRYVLKVTMTLSQLPGSSFAAAYRAQNPIQHIVRITQAVIEPVLRAMDAARASSRLAVDTPAAIQELETPCAAPA